MVFKKKVIEETAEEEVVEDAKVVPEPEEAGQTAPQEQVSEAPVEVEEEPTEEQVMQVPVFVTQADINRMVYENNVMLKQIIEVVQQEVSEDKN